MDCATSVVTQKKYSWILKTLKKDRRLSDIERSHCQLRKVDKKYKREWR